MKKKILVADDDPSILEVIKIILEENDYQVIAVEKGSQVIKKVQQTNPDLVLTDIWMSGFDGGEITKSLKKDAKTKNIKIIVLSANNSIKKIAEDIGADGYLAKPFDMHELLNMAKKYT